MKQNFVPDRRSRFAGCLLGGAVGDALGYPVEFKTEKDIFSKYGPEGIQTLDQAGNPAVITDDTQMTLFTANGLLYGMTRTGESAERKDIWLAMREWLHTQEDGVKGVDPFHPAMWLTEKPQLFVQRAPGITCLKAIRMSMVGGTIDDPINNSKGCGGVMRVAPFGLVSSVLNEAGADHATRFAAEAAAQTHGHFLGYLSGAMLARIVWNIVHEPAPEGEHPLAEIVLQAGRDTEKLFPNAWNMVRRAAEVVEMALDETVSDLNGVHESGEGWVGEEALYTAIFCAVRHESDFAAAIRCAVNHKGDSDSTGAVCGNILGAWLGREAVEAAFDLNHLEMRDLIETVADDLYQAAENGLDPADDRWKQRYCRGGVTEIPERRKKTEETMQPRTDCDEIRVAVGELNLERLNAEAIAVSTDVRFSGSGGLDKAVHERAGAALNEACKAFGNAMPGDVYVTDGFGLPVKKIVHVITPRYAPDREEDLVSCYYRCLTACRTECASAAVPLLGTGYLGWPKEVSAACLWKALLQYVRDYGSQYFGGMDTKLRDFLFFGNEEAQNVLRPYLKRRSRAFFNAPQQWGLRGDPHFWYLLMRHFDSTVFDNLPLEGFVREILDQFRKTTGRALTKDCQFYVKELDHGGMSGGGVSGFWARKGIPLLCEQFCRLQLDGPVKTAPVAIGDVERCRLPENILPLLNGILNSPGDIEPLKQTGLIYTPLTKKAMEICITAHGSQKDKSGLPYILHPFHLAERMQTEAEVCVALLHDVVEDTPWTLHHLREAGFPETVVQAVHLMTHHPGTPYFEYVERIRQNPIARRVKLADLEHNSDPHRLDNPTKKDKERREKYLKAIEILKREF